MNKALTFTSSFNINLYARFKYVILLSIFGMIFLINFDGYISMCNTEIYESIKEKLYSL